MRNGLAGEVALRTFDQREILNQQNQIFEDSLQLSRSIRNQFYPVGRDLVRMVSMYDERFFGGKVLPLARAEGMDFSISSRMTKVAGKLVTHYPDGAASGRRRFEMVLSSTLLFQTFEDKDQASS